MSEFSDLLNQWIHKKNVKIVSLVQYCGIDRSTMYKIIRGKRLPSSQELLEKIIGFLELTLSESNALKNAYYITSIGKETYYRRKNILDFLVSFFDAQALPSPVPSLLSSPLSNNKTSLVCPLNGQTQINNMVHQIISEEIQNNKGIIQLIIQPDYSFLFHLLTSISQKYSSYSDHTLKIEHILCLDNTGCFLPDMNYDYNISCLKALLPLLFCLEEYNPYYYYDNVNSHFNGLSLMPCLILTSNSAIICSANIQYGILFRDTVSVLSFQYMFLEQLANTKPLTEKLNDYSLDTSKIEQQHPEDFSFVIQAEPLLRLLMEPFHIEKYVKPDVPNRKQSVAFLCQSLYNGKKKNVISNSMLTFTQNGILNFLETGRVTELPEAFFDTISLEDRQEMLRKLYQLSLTGHFRLLKGSLTTLPKSAHVSIHQHQMFLMFPDPGKQLALMILKESSLLSAFLDFARSAEENGIIASTEESSSFLKSVLDKTPKSLGEK